MCHLVARGIYIRWQHLIFVLCTMIQLYKEDWVILHMFGCRACSPGNSSNCLVLIPHRQLGNFIRCILQRGYVLHLEFSPFPNVSSRRTERMLMCIRTLTHLAAQGTYFYDRKRFLKTAVTYIFLQIQCRIIHQ